MFICFYNFISNFSEPKHFQFHDKLESNQNKSGFNEKANAVENLNASFSDEINCQKMNSY